VIPVMDDRGRRPEAEHPSAAASSPQPAITGLTREHVQHLART
jgi:hypothetical protein